jgi:MFS family permease
VNTPTATAADRTVLLVSVAAAALGYFVDLFDIVIFGVVRVSSLSNLGLSGDAITDWGIRLLNLQMLGMLVGGFFWGVLGDRLGRRFTLIATITVFSLANILNAFVMNVGQYAALRFVAGFGLAGELGAGVTLVSELLPEKQRGYGTTVVSFLGLVGALTASWVGGAFDWRMAYLVGGAMGVAVLTLRFLGMAESGMYEKQAGRTPPAQGAIVAWIALPLIALMAALIFRKDLEPLAGAVGLPAVALPALLGALTGAGLLTRWRGFILKFYAVAAIGVPIWYVSALFVNLAPEFGKALGLTDFDPKTFVAHVLSFQAAGLAIGSAVSGVVSEALRSRKRVLYACLVALMLLLAALLQAHSARSYAWLMLAVGLFQGYWTAFVTMAAEQFGTDVRASVATSAPNIVRAMTVPVTLSVSWLAPVSGWTGATLVVGAVVFTLALGSLAWLKETWGKNLDYRE